MLTHAHSLPCILLGVIARVRPPRILRPQRGGDASTLQRRSQGLSAPPRDAGSHGNLQGEAHFTASAITFSADTPATGVVFVIGDTVVAGAKLGGKRGTLVIKNAAAFRAGTGDLSDTQVILTGTGDFVDASGTLRISGADGFEALPLTTAAADLEGSGRPGHSLGALLPRRFSRVHRWLRMFDRIFG